MMKAAKVRVMSPVNDTDMMIPAGCSSDTGVKDISAAVNALQPP